MTTPHGAAASALLEPLLEERMRFDLAPMRELVASLGHPEADLPAILVAGTNGKGTVAALLASIANAAGYRTGLYTSPHLEAVRERIRIDGRSVGENLLVSWLERVLRASGPERPTYFEALTAAAFLGFREAEVDLAILEVGLGGRLDATNVAQPTVSVVSSIDLDHGEILGETLEAIASEKAGIFRAGAAALTAETRKGPLRVLEARAREAGTSLVAVAGEMSPGYARNAALAAATGRRLSELGWGRIDEEAIRTGIDRLRWPGRMERVELPGLRSILFDCAHNPAAAEALAVRLGDAGERRALLFGCLADKDATGMLRALLGRVGSVYLTTPPRAPRARSAGDLREIVGDLSPGRSVRVGEWPDLLDLALEAEKDLLVTGSFRVVGPARTRARDRFGTPAPAADPLWPSERQSG